MHILQVRIILDILVVGVFYWMQAKSRICKQWICYANIIKSTGRLLYLMYVKNFWIESCEMENILNCAGQWQLQSKHLNQNSRFGLHLQSFVENSLEISSGVGTDNFLTFFCCNNVAKLPRQFRGMSGLTISATTSVGIEKQYRNIEYNIENLSFL